MLKKKNLSSHLCLFGEGLIGTNTQRTSQKPGIFLAVCTARNAILGVLKMPSAPRCAVLVSQCFITQSVSNMLTVYLVRTIINDVIKSVSLPSDQILMLFLRHPTSLCNEIHIFLQSPLDSYNKGSWSVLWIYRSLVFPPRE